MNDETTDVGGYPKRGQRLRGPIGSARLGQVAYDRNLHPFGIGSRAPLSEPSEMPQHYPIKGNTNASDLPVYHRPDSTEYRATRAEVWFDSPSAAEVAGFALADAHPPGLTSDDFEPGGSEHGWTRLDVENARHAALLGPARPPSRTPLAKPREEADDVELRHSRVVDDRTVPAAPSSSRRTEETAAARTSELPATGGLAGLFANRTMDDLDGGVADDELFIFGETTQPAVPAAGSADASPGRPGAGVATSGAGRTEVEVTGEIPSAGAGVAGAAMSSSAASPSTRPAKQRPASGADQGNMAEAGATGAVASPIRTRGVAAGSPARAAAGLGSVGGPGRLLWWAVGGIALIVVLGFLLSQCTGGGADDQAGEDSSDASPSGAESLAASSDDLQLRTRTALSEAGFEDIQVEVEGTRVRLVGSVDSVEDWLAAESAAVEVDGMGSIDNDLVVAANPAAPLAQDQTGGGLDADDSSGSGEAGAAADDDVVADNGVAPDASAATDNADNDAETPAADPVEKDPDYTG